MEEEPQLNALGETNQAGDGDGDVLLPKSDLSEPIVSRPAAAEAGASRASVKPLELDLDQYRVGKGSVDTVYYIPNFIDQREEEALLRNVARVPIPRWTQLANRRLQNWGGHPSPKGMLAEEIPPWLKCYTEKIGNLNIFNNHVPNHVLVNEYLPGQGIMPHLDGALFYPTITTINLGSHTILNFYKPISDNPNETNNHSNDEDTDKVNESSNGQQIKSWSDRLAFQLFLEPRSLVILKDKAYDYYLHGIEETKVDSIARDILNSDSVKDYNISMGAELERSTRVSLTIRYVPKTTKKPIFKLGR